MGSAVYPASTVGREGQLVADAIAFNAALTKSWYDDLNGPIRLFPRSGSGGAVTFPNTESAGVASLATSVTASGFVDIRPGSAASAVIQVSNPRTKPWYCSCRAKLPVLTANSRFRVGGMFDTSLAHMTSLAIIGSGAGTGVLNFESDGVIGAATTWAIESTVYHDFRLAYDGTTLFAIVDGVPVGSTAVQPHTQASSVVAQAFNNAVASNEILLVDDLFVAMGAP